MQDESVLEEAMNAIILYDEFELAAKANALLKRVAQTADTLQRAVQPWSIKPWRLDLLMQPVAADRALRDAAEAHLMVLAVRDQGDLPLWLFDWLEQWAGRRQVQDPALAVFDGNGNGDNSGAPDAVTTTHLSRFAGHHGLNIIQGGASPAKDEAADSAHDLHEREVVVTPTLQRAMAAPVHVPYPHFGINE